MTDLEVGKTIAIGLLQVGREKLGRAEYVEFCVWLRDRCERELAPPDDDEDDTALWTPDHGGESGACGSD